MCVRRRCSWLLAASCCLASAAVSAAGFYDREAEGWFWYRDPAPVPEPVEPAAPQPPPSPEVKPQPPAATREDGPVPLSAAWFRENIEAYGDRAIDNPTPENVELYYLLQRVMLDKSQRFAEASERVVTGHALLDEIARRPTATFGANLANRTAADHRDEVLRRIAGVAALWFFYRSDCPYCNAQAPLLQLLEQRYDFGVVPIALDGRPLPDGQFPDFLVDAGQAARLGVDSTPALFLVRPDTGSVSAISRGLLSLAQLNERIVIAAAREGWITEDEAASTQPVAVQETLPGLAPGAPSDPEMLRNYLKALATPRREASP